MTIKYYIELANSRVVDGQDFTWTDVHRVWPTDEYRTIVHSRETHCNELSERKVRMRFCWFFRRDIWVNPKKIRCKEVIGHIEKEVMWEDYFPRIEELKAMCKVNPALANAYEKFKNIYRLIEEKK
jgi:hypothetical protein